MWIHDDTGVEVLLGSKVPCTCFLKFALSPFSTPLPSVVQISKQNRHSTYHTRILSTCVQCSPPAMLKIEDNPTWEQCVPHLAMIAVGHSLPIDLNADARALSWFQGSAEAALSLG